MAFPPPTSPEDERTELIDFMGTKYPFKVATPPPERFDPAKARADTAALASGPLTQTLVNGGLAASVSQKAVAELAGGRKPAVEVLKDWQAGLPERGTPSARPGTVAGLAERMDACMTPLLEGVRGLLTRQAAAQRGHEDKLAAVAWLNGCARLAAGAPPALAADSAARLGQALGDPGMGKIFLDKVAYYRVLGDLERDAGRELSDDPRLAGVSPEIREDLEGDRRRLAREQGLSRQVAAARGRAAFSLGLAGAFAAARRGEAGPAYAREQFLELYGPREGEARWQAYQVSQAKAPAYALVRGRSAAEIAAAKAGYGGDHTLLHQVEAEDAAERRRDPAGYGLAWAPGARAAYDQAGDPGEQAAILWEAQAAAGIPAPERSPWSGAAASALAEGWLAIPDGPGAAKARIDLLRQGLLSLPAEQRAAGLATLERMLSGGTAAGPLGSIVAALEDNRLGDAYATAGADWRPVSAPGLVQIADGGDIASDADPGIAGATGASLEQDGIDPAGTSEASAGPVFVNPPGLGRAQGLPDAGGGTWREAAYDPARQNRLEGLLASILALPENPRARERVLGSIRQVFADDPATAAQLTDWANSIASAGDDTPVGPLESARAGVHDMYERVKAGAPYDATWAAARDELASLEETTGYRVLPAAPGTVAVLDSAGRALLELPLKGLGALPQAKLGQYLGDIEGLLSGELSSEALAGLAGRYDEADVRGRGGELPDETLLAGDHRAAEAVRNAYAAAQAHPGQRTEIARDLLQVLIERDSDLDLEELALETALEFLPGKGLYDLGVDAVQMARAIDDGDWSALATLGGVALLDAIGSVPGVGPLAERGLRRLARGVGILKSAGREAAERIATLARAGVVKTQLDTAPVSDAVRQGDAIVGRKGAAVVGTPPAGYGETLDSAEETVRGAFRNVERQGEQHAGTVAWTELDEAGQGHSLLDESHAAESWTASRETETWIAAADEASVAEGRQTLAGALDERTGWIGEVKNPAGVEARLRDQHLRSGSTEPRQQSYASGLPIYKIESQAGERFVRVFVADEKFGLTGQVGRWMAREADLKHPDGTWLSPREIKERFALPSVPTHYSVVTPPAGTLFYLGIAATNKYGRGGGVQIQAAGELKVQWFGTAVAFKSREAK